MKNFLETAIQKFINNNSNSITSYLDIAFVQLSTNKKNEMYKTFQECIEKNGLKSITCFKK